MKICREQIRHETRSDLLHDRLQSIQKLIQSILVINTFSLLAQLTLKIDSKIDSELMKRALGLSVFKESEPLTPVSTGCPRKKWNLFYHKDIVMPVHLRPPPPPKKKKKKVYSWKKSLPKLIFLTKLFQDFFFFVQVDRVSLSNDTPPPPPPHQKIKINK